MNAAVAAALTLTILLGASANAQALRCPPEVPAAEFLSEVRDATLVVLGARCAGEDEARLMRAYDEFLDQIAGWFDPYGGFQNGERPVEHIKSLITRGTIDSVAVGMSLDDHLSIQGKQFIPASVRACERRAGEQCAFVTDEFVRLYTLAQNAYSSFQVAPVVNNLAALRERWDPFLDQMRGQTSLELAVNGWWFKKNESDEFAPPPDKQWIVLHPTVLIENVADASDGEHTQEALGVEIFGINWWQQEKWYVPTGASLITLYSDRDEVHDWGYGVAVHFRSVYTLGVANHDGDTGVFVSLDLLKLFQDKSNAFRAYTDRE